MKRVEQQRNDSKGLKLNKYIKKKADICSPGNFKIKEKVCII